MRRVGALRVQAANTDRGGGEVAGIFGVEALSFLGVEAEKSLIKTQLGLGPKVVEPSGEDDDQRESGVGHAACKGDVVPGLARLDLSDHEASSIGMDSGSIRPPKTTPRWSSTCSRRAPSTAGGRRWDSRRNRK